MTTIIKEIPFTQLVKVEWEQVDKHMWDLKLFPQLPEEIQGKFAWHRQSFFKYSDVEEWERANMYKGLCSVCAEVINYLCLMGMAKNHPFCVDFTGTPFTETTHTKPYLYCRVFFGGKNCIEHWFDTIRFYEVKMESKRFVSTLMCFRHPSAFAFDSTKEICELVPLEEQVGIPMGMSIQQRDISNLGEEYYRNIQYYISLKESGEFCDVFDPIV